MSLQNEDSSMCLSTMEMSSPMSDHRVNFTTVEIQEYPIIPGDNPSVSTGVPLTIDWMPLNKNAYDFEEYEQAVEETRRTCRAEIRVPPSRRMEVLRQLGVSRGEIQEVIKAVNAARKQRQRTNELLGLAPAQFAIERLSSAVKNATVKRSEKRTEKALLESCVSPVRAYSPSSKKSRKRMDSETSESSNPLTETILSVA